MGLFDKIFSKKDEPEQISQEQDLAEEGISEDEITPKMREYMAKFTDESSPGWDAISDELDRLYPQGKERHYATLMKYIFGGDNPLDGVSVFDCDEQEFHRHIVSYGMSELYYEPKAAEAEFSRWGFEFSMRVVPFKDDHDDVGGDDTKVKNEPHWAVNLMQNLARYVYESEKWFEAYHFIPTNSPIRAETDTKLVGIVFAPDPRLGDENGEILTPNGKLTFLQMVGITQRELDWLWQDPKTSRAKELVDMMRVDNPLLITDLNRQKEYV